jgi:mannose/fructose/N-acetylgalactosamine-specific phosphotransferase system component IIC
MLVLSLTLIGSLLLLDKYALGEFGFSQPIIACPVIGLIFGSPEAGLMLGIMVQLLFFSNLPIGRSIPPDSQAGGILGVSSFILLRDAVPPENLMTFSLLLAIVGSVLATYPDILVRRISNHLYQHFMHDQTRCRALHMLGLGLVFMRGVIFFAVMLVLVWAFQAAAWHFRIDRVVLVMVALAVGTANAVYLFYKRKYVPFLIAGGLIGCLYQYFVS